MHDAFKSGKKYVTNVTVGSVVSRRSIEVLQVIVGIGVRESTGFTVRISASVTLFCKPYRLHDTFGNQGYLKQAFR